MTPDSDLSEVDWREVVPRLLLYAAWVHRRTLAAVPGSPEPEDLVQNAIGKVLEGRRTLPDSRTVATIDALRWAIKSEADNARRKAARRGDVRLSDLSREPAGDARPHDRDGAAELWRLIRARVGDDDELVRVVDLLEQDPDRPAWDIAQETGWTRGTVYRAMRRLRYRLASLEEDLRGVVGGGE